jgi:two-component system sensor histidine kinase/response regulator
LSPDSIDDGGADFQEEPMLRPLAIVTALTAFAGVVGLPGTGGAQARTLAEIKKDGELRLCYVAWSMLSDGSSDQKGPDYELGLVFAKELGVKVRERAIMGYELFAGADGKIDATTAEAPQLIKTDACDIYVANISILPWRQRKVDIVPVYPGRTIVAVRLADKDKYKSVDDLAGKSTMVRERTTYHDWLDAQNAKRLKAKPVTVSFSTKTIPISTLVDGKVDFLMYDTLIALYLVSHFKDKVHLAFPVGANDLLGWAVKKDDGALRDALLKFLDAQRKTAGSEMNKIFQSYFQISVAEYEGIVYASQSADE